MEEKWAELVEKSQGLKVPAMVSGLNTVVDCEYYLDLLKSVVISFAEKNDPFSGLKIFLKGQQDNAQNERLMNLPPNKNESLKDWGNRFFNGEPHGLILNFLENYNNDIVQKMAKTAAPLLSSQGYPLSGLSMLFFMGDYGFTPFGVHKGSPGEDGFLFHLGPAEKTFYFWDTDEYNALTNHSPVYKDTKKILHAAKSYQLKPGDVMYIPNDVYHVANTEEFSASLVLDYRRPSTTHLKRLLVEKLEFDSKNGDWLSPISANRFGSDNRRELIDQLGFNKDLENVLQEHLLSLKGNGGFLSPAIKSVTKTKPSLRLKEPFKIQYILSDTHIELFVRGHQLRITRNDRLIEFINQLNSGDLSRLDSLNNEMAFDPSYIELLLNLSQADIFEVE